MSGAHWHPNVGRGILEQRAKFLELIRQFFKQRGVIEVDTPVLSRATVTDPYLHPIQVPQTTQSEETLFLQTSPEYAMKRLLAAGSGDIFQICKAFRGAEVGRLHNPEFYLLEWYRLDFDIHKICAELSDLLGMTLATDKAEIVTYREVFMTYLNVDIEHATDPELTELVAGHCPGLDCHDRDDMLSALFATCIEPNLGADCPVIISHYPASQASLARLDINNPDYALRFEAFYRGIELANGFVELTDAREQEKRFQKDNFKRQLSQLPTMPIDSNLIAALEYGLPNCSGVALGIERLLMLALEKDSIAEVMAFPFNKA
ncbi:MAG: elongation factor P--(R)-beta-lysine ligase [Enterobacterales bacterium]|nr:elongation factor P--(R)-beta-lysine ligase [Enterobacterales bacterium]